MIYLHNVCTYWHKHLKKYCKNKKWLTLNISLIIFASVSIGQANHWRQSTGHASIRVCMADDLSSSISDPPPTHYMQLQGTAIIRHGADQRGQRYEHPKKPSLLRQTQWHTGGMLFYRPATTIHYSYLVLSGVRVNRTGVAGGNKRVALANRP